MRKKTKFLLLRASIIAVFAILAGRLWYVQVVMGSYYAAQGDTSKIRIVPVPALRGVIYDNSGHNQLVFNTASWSVEIVPHGIPDSRAGAIYRTLSHLLHGDPSPATIARIVRANLWRPYTAVSIRDKVSTDTAMLIKQLHGQLPGVRAEPTSIRSYLADGGRFSLAHLLGYTDGISSSACATYAHLYPVEHVDCTDQAGATGVEATLDAYLHGVNGRQQVEVDAGERPIRVLRPGHAVPGDSVALTLNWPLQRQVSADLAAGLAHVNLSRGTAILEDVNSGRILAMVSLPSYNSDLFSGGISQTKYNAIAHAPGDPLVNQATQGQFPPGSTYKIITAAAALKTGVVNAGTIIDDTGQIKPCATCIVFHGWKPGGIGPVNVVRALAMSSDIYFYTVTGGNPAAYPQLGHIGGERLAVWAKKFGLGSPTGIEMDESPGFVPTPSWFNALKPTPNLKNPGDTWSIGYDYNSAIGQGFDLATPLQMVNVAATIANGGTVYRPRIVQSIWGRVIPRVGVLPRPQVIQPFVPSVLRRNILDPYTLELIRTGMHQSVTNDWNTGTSKNVYDPRIDAAGKTGTAEAAGGAHGWWVGYAPFNHPKVAVVVMVPNANAEGAYVAAPIARKVLQDYFHLKPATPDWLTDVTAPPAATGGSQ